MRSRIVFTGRLRFAEINTHDLPASMRSSNRRSSSGVQFVPRCCTAIRIRSFLRLRYRRRLSVIFLRSIFSLMARERTACSVRFNCIPISRAFTSVSDNERSRSSSSGVHGLIFFPPPSSQPYFFDFSPSSTSRRMPSFRYKSEKSKIHDPQYLCRYHRLAGTCPRASASSLPGPHGLVARRQAELPSAGCCQSLPW
jgi:hypothetical protein